MADAWTNLLVHSSLPATGHDAWEHLLAQEGGGGKTVYADGFDIEIGVEAMTCDINSEILVAEIDSSEISIDLGSDTIECYLTEDEITIELEC